MTGIRTEEIGGTVFTDSIIRHVAWFYYCYYWFYYVIETGPAIRLERMMEGEREKLHSGKH